MRTSGNVKISSRRLDLCITRHRRRPIVGRCRLASNATLVGLKVRTRKRRSHGQLFLCGTKASSLRLSSFPRDECFSFSCTPVFSAGASRRVRPKDYTTISVSSGGGLPTKGCRRAIAFRAGRNTSYGIALGMVIKTSSRGSCRLDVRANARRRFARDSFCSPRFHIRGCMIIEGSKGGRAEVQVSASNLGGFRISSRVTG